MILKEVQLEHLKTGQMASGGVDKICHRKTLPVLTVAQALEGSYDFAVGNTPLQNTGEGGFFIAPAQKPQTIVHNTSPVTGKMRARWAFFTLKINRSYKAEDLYRFPPILPKDKEGAMKEAFDRLFSTENPFEQQRQAYRIAEILWTVAREYRKPIPPVLLPCLEYIEAYYPEKITVEHLAELTNLSQSRFRAVFRQALGISPIAYLNSFRLSAAATLLEQTGESVGEIAFRVGIRDGIYFNKMFRKAYQMAPRHYREIHKEKEARL